MAEVMGVDTQHHLVQSQESDLPYDYLILATGAHYNYFARPSERPVPAALDQRRMAACDRYPVASHGGGD
jgi:NADH dehydrogenase